MSYPQGFNRRFLRSAGCRFCSPGRGRRGFTLIELLVVIAIISLLVSITVPSLQRAKTQANRVVCSTSQRAVVIAIHMYQYSWNDLYPMARLMPPPFLAVDPNPPLVGQLTGYIVEPDCYKCPGDKRQVFRRSQTSYAYNFFLSGHSMTDVGGVIYPQGPQQCPVVWDCDDIVLPLEDGGNLNIKPFHEFRNAGFADGHAEPIDPEEVPYFPTLKEDSDDE
jgi:prepilin-type N-terminal cleavage/methylation domain-containing protein/prepilin-type processing-associated H-X9-DG protein